MSGQRLCLKVFDQYSLLKEGKLYPVDDEVRAAFRKALLATAERHGIKALEEDFLLEPARF